MKSTASKLKRTFHGTSSRGLTLVEVLVASALLTVLSLAIISSVILAATMTQINKNATVARNIAQSYVEQMYADEFDDVIADNYPDINEDSETIIWIDQYQGIRCYIDFEFSGFGTIENSSKKNLTDAKAHWKHDQWAGDTVFLVEGEGAGQFGIIEFNTPNTLHLEESLEYRPRKGTKYMINSGKTVEFTVTWKYRGKEYGYSSDALIINAKNISEMGF